VKLLWNSLKKTRNCQSKASFTKKPYKKIRIFLADNPYLAGPQLTIADFSIVATVSTLHLSYCPVEDTKYPKLSAWLARLSSLPFYEEDNLRGARLLADKIRAKLPKQFDKLWQKAFEEIKSGAGKQWTKILVLHC